MTQENEQLLTSILQEIARQTQNIESLIQSDQQQRENLNILINQLGGLVSR